MTAANENLIIYDLCGGTGAWSEPYRQANYDVRIIDIENVSGQNFETCDICHYEFPAGEKIYGILAAVPCAEFSLAKQTAERDFRSGLAVLVAVLQLVWQAKLEHDLKFWAIENPVGYMRQFLGIAPFKFEQWEFGHPFKKATEIWGYFNPPAKTHTILPAAESLFMIEDIVAKDRKRQRAITPKGFANAFFKANHE